MHVTLYSNYDQYQDKAHNRDIKVHVNAVTEVILQSRDVGAAQLSWVYQANANNENCFSPCV